eukprot:967337_1
MVWFHVARHFSAKRKYTLNEYFFSDLNKESSYWFGFVCADGGIRKNRRELCVELKCTDYHHVHKMLKCMNADYPIKYLKRINSLNAIFCSCRVGIYSRTLCHALCELGCHPNKTFSLEWPIGIPAEYHRDFVRGYFDGDVCVAWDRRNRLVHVSFAGTDSMLTGIRTVLKQYACPTYKSTIRRVRNSSILQFCGNSMPLSVLDYMYKDASWDARLDRKYALYQKYKEILRMQTNDRNEAVDYFYASKEWKNIIQCKHYNQCQCTTQSHQ